MSPNSEPDRARAFSPANSEQGSISSGPWLPLSQETEIGESSSMASTEKQTQEVDDAPVARAKGNAAGGDNNYDGAGGGAEVLSTGEEEKKDEGGGFVTAQSSVVAALSSDESNTEEGDEGDKDDTEAGGESENATTQADRTAPSGPSDSSAATSVTSRSSRPLPPTVPFVCLASGLRRKADPTALKSWVALSLTLDGRDKITKIFQYLSRLLGWYYESAARRVAGNVLGSDGAAEALLNKAKRFRALQKHLTESRKAFRLGRSLIEVEKLRGMGWGAFLAYHLRRAMLAEGESFEVKDDGNGGVGEGAAAGQEDGNAAAPSPASHVGRAPINRRASSNVGWGPTTTFGEDDTTERSSRRDTTAAAAANTNDEKDGPPRLLFRRASTNIGWGPATAPVAPPSSSRRSSFYRTVSQLGRRMYRPLTSQLSALPYGEEAPSTPAWKLVGATLKLLGLMGFWMGDNVGFLRGTGFLDDYSLPSDERAKARAEGRLRAAHFAARAYFLGCVSGLYVSLREALRHRNGPLRKAVELVADLEGKRRRVEGKKSKRTSWDMESVEDDEEKTDVLCDEVGDREFEAARSALEDAKGKQFVLFLALLKSCCDVLVFSNNPGVDLHKRYRGKKNHEGFHSVCGLLSASTVLYNNFPNCTMGR